MSVRTIVPAARPCALLCSATYLRSKGMLVGLGAFALLLGSGDFHSLLAQGFYVHPPRDHGPQERPRPTPDRPSSDEAAGDPAFTAVGDEEPADDDPQAIALRTALGRSVTFGYRSTPLAAAVEQLAQLNGFRAVLDLPALQAAGIDHGQSVTCDFHDAPLETALEKMLEPLGLRAVDRRGVLLITTARQAQQERFTRYYPAGDFLHDPRLARELREVLELALYPVLSEFRDLDDCVTRRGSQLQVELSVDGHRLVAETLDLFRLARARQQQLRGPERYRPIERPDPGRAAIEAALQRPWNLDVDGVLLRQLPELLAKQFGLPAILDESDHQRGGGRHRFGSTALWAHRASAGVVLRHLLQEAEQAYYIRDGRLHIAASDDRAVYSRLVFYPLGDLFPVADPVADPDDDPLDELDELLWTISAEWDDAGGPGDHRVCHASRLLAVRHNDEVQRNVVRWLADLVQAPAADPPPVDPLAGYTLRRPGCFDETVTPMTPVEQQLQRALASPGVWDFQEAPLGDMVRDVAARYAIPVLVDHSAFKDDPTILKRVVSAPPAPCSLGFGLQWMLEEYDLHCTPTKDGLVVHFDPEALPVTHLYPAADLWEAPDFWGDDELVDVLTTCVSSHTWDDAGGRGAVRWIPSIGCLSVYQTPAVHSEIQELLRGLRAAQAIARAGREQPPAPLPPHVKPASLAWLDSPATARLEAALERPISVEFKATPFNVAVDYISRVIEAPILVRRVDFDMEGLALDMPITLQAHNMPARELCERLLISEEMGLRVEREAIVLGYPMLKTRVYPVGDLVRTVDTDEPDYASLIELLAWVVDPSSWDDTGGPATLYRLDAARCLVINQTVRNHAELSLLLGRLRTAMAMAEGRRPTSLALGVDPQRFMTTAAPLLRPAQYDYRRLTLQQAVACFEEETGLKVRMEVPLEELPARDEQPQQGEGRVLVDVPRPSVGNAFAAALRRYSLSYRLNESDGSVSILPESAPRVLVYPVGRLLRQRGDGGLPDYEQVIERLHEISPDSWDENGGPGAAREFEPGECIVISQEDHVHAQIMLWLAKEQRPGAGPRRGGRPALQPVPRPDPGPAR